MGPKPIFIADGHHRYETACNYRDELVAAGGPLPPQHPANFVLMMCVGMSDPGLLVLPTHRLFRGLPKLTHGRRAGQAAGRCVSRTRPAGEGTDAAHEVWDEIETAGDQGTLGLFTQADGQWTLATITAGRPGQDGRAGRRAQRRLAGTGREHPAPAGGRQPAGRRRPGPSRAYVHLVEEVVESLDTGEFPLAALVMPATVEHIRAISEHGERMPAKSTYFYPKLLSGLVINPLE